MTPRIAVLPNEVSDQIAAGEVVDRPASVVKELIENALDAGASRIAVELEEGGRRLVRVADDGAGMAREDAVLAVERHATSKIRAIRDLIGIESYGFRGEALAAIASVSRFELETAPATGDGTRIRVQGGRVEAIEACARRRGTTVAVRTLFHNTPARRKFLRSTKTEQRAAVEAVTVLALARPDVAFHLVADGRVVLETGAGDSLDERVAATWGRRLAQTLVPIDWHEGALAVTGFVQRPGDAGPAGRRVQLFINRRPFRDHFLARAAEDGYVTTLAPGNRPSMLLTLELPGDGVDVNVHPAKLEVRFRDRRWVERGVTEAVRAALGQFGAAVAVGPGWGGGPEGGAQPATGTLPQWWAAPLGPQGDLLVHAASGDAPAGAAPATLLQVFDAYILFAADSDVAIVDQHSAHERVIYERTMREIGAGTAAGQRLLMPLTLELTAPELEAIDEHKDLLGRLGYEIEPFGGNAIVVHTVPHPHPRFDAERCLLELTSDLARGRFGAWTNRLERFVATYACRAAIKAGLRLDEREMRHLIEGLLTTDLPPHDVHGRPTVVRLPRDELERRFGRR